ncbi:MAG: hypothetical protein M0C28_46155 [Candidatus Moduliflexus flocculans]|nr:hypothetical protein [Candidatus Moduliflexus flocculans]
MLSKQQEFYRSLTALSPGLVERVRAHHRGRREEVHRPQGRPGRVPLGAHGPGHRASRSSWPRPSRRIPTWPPSRRSSTTPGSSTAAAIMPARSPRRRERPPGPEDPRGIRPRHGRHRPRRPGPALPL